MTDDEQQLVKASAEAALKPFADLCQKLFGGAAEEIGGIWQDSLKVRRFGRQIKLLRRVQELLQHAGIDPQRVKDTISIPLLNAATLEDDECLQDKWACLLANAANPAASPPISAQFPKILANLSAREVAFLDLYCTFSAGHVDPTAFSRNPGAAAPHGALVQSDLIDLAGKHGFTWKSEEEREGMLAHLISEGLIKLEQISPAHVMNFFSNISRRPANSQQSVMELRPIFQAYYRMTVLGMEFVMACRPPSKRS